MAGPMDYSLGGPVDPSAALMQGVQAGAALRALPMQQQMQDLQLQQAQQGVFAQQQAYQQQQQAIQTQQQQRQALMAVISNPKATASDYASLAALLPKESGEMVLKAWDAKSKDQQLNDLQDTGQVFAALNSGQPQVAVKLLRDRAGLLKDTDQNQAKALETMAGIAESHPEFAKALVGMKLAAVPGGDKVISNIATLGKEGREQELQPSAVVKAEADARAAKSDAETKAVQAKYAESTTLQDLALKGWQVKNIESEIGYRKEANRIAAMNAAANRESNVLKRQELQLKIDETRQAIEDKARAKVADVEAARSGIDNLINTADKILSVHTKTPGVAESAHGPLSSRIPTTSQATADYEALVETIGSQAFIAQIPAMKGTGSLSEREGDKLQASLQNLGLKQSPASMRAAVEEVQRLMLKARKNLATRYGVPESVPDTPAASPSSADIDALIKKYSR